MSSDLAFGSRGGSFPFGVCFCFAVDFRALLDCLFFFEDVGGAAFFWIEFPFLFFGFFPGYLDFFGLGPPPIRLTGRST